MSNPAFLTPEEARLGQDFLRDGYVITPVETREGLDRIRNLVAEAAAKFLGETLVGDAGIYLDTIHERIDVPRLNDLRLAVIGTLRATEWFRPTYYALARSALAALVGSELAMQRGIGLSVQLPQDESSLLSIHADVWDGDSEYEVVVWLPLVDCYRTKSMYIMPPQKDRAFQKAMARENHTNAEDIFQSVKDDVIFLTVPYGTALIFSQTIMHGNRVNEESSSRWSMNCRFKGLLAPYADKRLGEFFEPITTRPATRLGLKYQLPDAFDE